MRKLREAIVATARTDEFALNVYSFIIQETILIGHYESYHPALLHLLRILLPAANRSREEVSKYVGYYILDLACRQSELERALSIMHTFAHIDRNVGEVLKALVRGDWVIFWRASQRMTRHQRELVQMADVNVRKHILSCFGSTYLSLDRAYLENAVKQSWPEIQRQQPTWQLEEETVVIRKIRKK